MLYVWIGVAIVILFLIGRIIRWYNLPKVAEARARRVEVRQKERTERIRIRRNRDHTAPEQEKQPGFFRRLFNRGEKKWVSRKH